MTQKYKRVQFKPLVFKKKLKEIWEQYGIYLDFEKEWRNFLNICDYKKIERIFAINNFLITEFLIFYCEVNPASIQEMNCYCDKNLGNIDVPIDAFIKHDYLIKNFMANFT